MPRHTWFFLAAAAALAACGGAGSSASLGAADAAVSAQLAQSGVQCVRELPPAAVQACAGLSAGDACTVSRHGQTVTGTCRSDDGRLMCARPRPASDSPRPSRPAAGGPLATPVPSRWAA